MRRLLWRMEWESRIPCRSNMETSVRSSVRFYRTSFYEILQVLQTLRHRRGQEEVMKISIWKSWSPWERMNQSSNSQITESCWQMAASVLSKVQCTFYLLTFLKLFLFLIRSILGWKYCQDNWGRAIRDWKRLRSHRSSSRTLHNPTWNSRWDIVANR